METVEKIDSDVQTLHSELDRHDGKRSVHCNKRCKYILGIAGLLLIMFLFGVLTRPAPQKAVVEEVLAVLDRGAKPVVEPEYSRRLATLHTASKAFNILVSTLTSTATEPRILTWSPASVGKTNADGSPVPLVGSYEVPRGWFGRIILTADGEEIGSTAIDARAITTPSQGRFTLIPTPITGEKSIRLAFDAVKACRISCNPDDQLCIATNVNYCTALYDNQKFLTYTPTLVAPLPLAGQCVTKTFVAGPKYSPQIPEDYTMCSKGMWNTSVFRDTFDWMEKNGAEKSIKPDVERMVESISAVMKNKQALEDGVSGKLSWKVQYHEGDSATKSSCALSLEVSMNCSQ